MSQQIADDLRKGLELIKKKGWTQAVGGKGPNGEICTFWGIRNALLEKYYIDHNVTPAMLKQRLQDALKSFGLVNGIECVPQWNDDPSTSFEDVELAFKKAIYAEEKVICTEENSE